MSAHSEDVVRNSQGFPELVSAPEAARILGVHPDTLKAWPVPYTRVGARGRRRYALADLRAVLERVRIEAPG